MPTWTKNCPECKATQVYSTWDSLRSAKRRNTLCSVCSGNKRSKNIVLEKICPDCKNTIHYTSYMNWWRANKLDRRCYECASILRQNTHFKNGHGHRLSENSRKKLSESLKEVYSNNDNRKKMSCIVKQAMHRPDVRKKHIEALHHSKWIKVRTDKGQLELLNKWNMLGFSFQPNYQIHTDTDLFYIDGYDSGKNVVLEYDTKYHNKPSQKTKDLVRQNKIIDILKPKKFWRYDAVNNTYKNVLERSE